MWRDNAYLLDMLLAAKKTLQYTHGSTSEQFAVDEMRQDAVIHMIQIIGEAARQVSPEFRQEHPEIPWAEIIGMRHKLVHDYLEVDLTEVWRVVQDDIPLLITQVESLIVPEEEL